MTSADQVSPSPMRHVTSSDGTRIAYEVVGEGRPLIFIGGILSDRSSLRDLSQAVAPDVAAVTFDRRGRGDSGDAAAYAVRDEVDDVRALAALFDQPPVLFGHSSGAGLAIETAVAGTPLAGLILYEPPYGFDDADSRRESAAFAILINGKLEAGDRSGAVRSFFEAMGLPPEDVKAMADSPDLQSRAGTMAYDFAVMGQIERGGVIPREELRRIEIPVLVLTGELSPPFFAAIAGQVAEALPQGSLLIVPGADHSARSDRLPEIVRAFLTELR